MAMEASSILECALYENLGYFPWGKISFLDKSNLIIANYDFKAYTSIEVTLGEYEGSEKSEVVFSGEIVSNSFKKVHGVATTYEIELVFVVRGTSGSLFSNVPASGYQNQSSIAVIKDICKQKKIPLKVQDNLTTTDNMNWLLVNYNFLTAMNFLCDRSYIEDSVLMYSILRDGSISLYSIAGKFKEKSIATLLSAPTNISKASLNNGKIKFFETPLLYFTDAIFLDQSPIAAAATSMVLADVKADNKNNKITSNRTTLASGVVDNNGGPNNVVYQPSGSPQVYDKYSMAPAYRRGIIAGYGLSLTLTCDNETFVNPGDVVDVLDGTYDERGTFVQSYKDSGKYLILRKGYHFMRDRDANTTKFVTTISLISNASNLVKDDGYKQGNENASGF